MIKNVLIAALVLVIIGTFGYILWQKNVAIPDRPEEAQLPLPTLETRTITEETAQYRVEVQYPVLTGIDPARAEKVNAALEAELRRGVAVFTKEVTSWEGEGFDAPFEDVKSELHVEYAPSLVRPELVSIIFQHSEYMAGAAHSLNFTSGWTWRLDTGELVTLEELFKPGAQYLPVLSGISRRELRETAADRGYFPEDIDRGTEPKVENFKFFALTERELIVFFSPYQVASYAAGIPEVRIPYSELSAVIDARGAIGVLTAP